MPFGFNILDAIRSYILTYFFPEWYEKKKCNHCNQLIIDAKKGEHEAKYHTQIKCPICNGRIEIKHWQNHQQEHKDKRERELLYCPFGCDAAFTKRADLSIHSDYFHPGPKSYRCSRCCKKFATQQRYKKHLNVCHNDIKRMPQQSKGMNNVNGECPRIRIAKQIINDSCGNIPTYIWKASGIECCCANCYGLKKDIHVPHQYIYFPFNVPSKSQTAAFMEMNQVKSKWDICFHGTSMLNVKELINCRLVLLKPGYTTFDGDILSMSHGINKAFLRRNKNSNEAEWFDPRKLVFVTPSIKYAEQYAKMQTFIARGGIPYRFNCIVGCYIHPKCYTIGHSTLERKDIDPNVPDKCIEWYTDQNFKILPHCLFIKIERCTPYKPFSLPFQLK